MGRMKEFATEVSESLGLGGEITDAVLAQAERQLDMELAKFAKFGKSAEREPKEIEPAGGFERFICWSACVLPRTIHAGQHPRTSGKAW